MLTLKLYHHKNLVLLEDLDIDNIQVYDMTFFAEKIINILLVKKIIITMNESIKHNASKNESACVKRYDSET